MRAGGGRADPALDLRLLCPLSCQDVSCCIKLLSSLLSEESSRAPTSGPYGRGRGRGNRSWRWRCPRGGGLAAKAPLLSAGLPAPSPGGLVGLTSKRHLHINSQIIITFTENVHVSAALERSTIGSGHSPPRPSWSGAGYD